MLIKTILGQRGERGLSKKIKRLPLFVISIFARKRRAKGYYDYRTLAMLRFVWLKKRSINALLDYVLFRRDLGFPLSKHWRFQLESNLVKLKLSRQKKAKLLLAEISSDNNSDVFSSTEVFNLSKNQLVWRKEFANYLRHISKQGVCVVGNSGGLLNSGLGEQIDKHALVVRFNYFRRNESDLKNVGSKVDIWVVAPDCLANMPDVQWVVVSGPDLLFHRQNWNHFFKKIQKETKVVTIPLFIWKDLVRHLQAPPSAGILFLAWLKSLLGSWDNINAAGFTLSDSQKTSYHYVSIKYKPNERHNWDAEKKILEKWRLEGLKFY